MRKSKNILSLFILLWAILCTQTILAQNQERVYINKGNRLYQKGLDIIKSQDKNKDMEKATSYFADAEINYRKAIAHNGQNATALYNLGNALLFQQKAKDAMKQFEKAVSLEKDSLKKAAIYHNMGYIMESIALNEKDEAKKQEHLKSAIACYQDALRNNPVDNETRYNLALCKHQIKEGENNQDKDKEEKDDKKQQQKPQQQPQQDEKKEQQPQKSKMSKDNADQLLQAAQMKENQTQQKVRKNQMRTNRQQMEKNW